MELTEFDFRVYGLDGRPIPLNQNVSAIAHWMNFAHRAVQQQGGEPDAANHLHRWTRENPLLENVTYRRFWFQTSPWNTGRDPLSAQRNRHGALMRDDILVSPASRRSVEFLNLTASIFGRHS
jgi:hypothetical protein